MTAEPATDESPMAVLMARVDAMPPLSDEDLDGIADILAAIEMRKATGG